LKLEELLKKGLIHKQSIDNDEIAGSIAVSEHFLKRAKGNLKMGFFDVAFLLAYNAMFHTARALLFYKGYKERGHYAMIEALKELYKEDSQLQEYLKVLDLYRITRHSIQYSGELSNELDAEAITKDAERFINFVKVERKIVH
jgi:uncharacterized protein (UPF0332 family)